jgi:hypothetical protein
MTPGATLHQLCQSATDELWLVAPFIKTAVLQRLLEGVSPSVGIQCVTRWRPEEIAMGVSDIDVWLLLKERGNSQLWLRHDLHAKYYRADQHCLIGSANLTATALGWSAQPNLEILLDVPIHRPSLRGFETQVLAAATIVDDTLYEQTKALVALLEPELKPKSYPEQEREALPSPSMDREVWLPSLRNPEQLYVAYSGERDRLARSVYEMAIADLEALNIPQGLSKSSFETYVGYMLLQMPIVKHVDAFVSQPRRFGEVAAYLKTLPCTNIPDFNAKHAWQTLMRWLMYFLSTTYESSTPHFSEIFTRKG